MNHFKQTLERLNLNDSRASIYLGVPVFTLRKWLKGERHPNSSAIRLLEILNLIEQEAPDLHNKILSKCAKTQ